MGLVKAAIGAAGAFSDQWLEAIEPIYTADDMVITKGANLKRSKSHDIIPNGSVIHVPSNHVMMLLDGGKIADYTAEEGYYTVNQSQSPSIFADQLDEAVQDLLSRFRFGGVPSQRQHVYYVNLSEIKGIKFGTKNPINYYDHFYNAELFLRAHGIFSIKVTDPLLFFMQTPLGEKDYLTSAQLNEQLIGEFVEALQSAINQLSAEGERISFLLSKSRLLSQYLSQILDDSWQKRLGIVVESAAIIGLSYDDESQELINLRNQGAMLSDPLVRAGYCQGAAARGMEKAASNAQGAVNGFLGYQMAARNMGAFYQASSVDQQWRCHCGHMASGNFCANCGANREQTAAFCPNCGSKTNGANFCSHCGQKLG